MSNIREYVWKGLKEWPVNPLYGYKITDRGNKKVCHLDIDVILPRLSKGF